MEKEFERLRIKQNKIENDIHNLFDEVQREILDEGDFDLLKNLIYDSKNCFDLKMEKYFYEIKSNNFNDLSNLPFDWSEGRRSLNIKEPSFSDCIQSMQDKKNQFRNSINVFPGETGGVCRPQCVVFSSGDWEFGDTKFRNDILSYWYRCFFTNRFTIIFTQSWQVTSWNKFKQLIDAYIHEQSFEVKGNWSKIKHTVIVLEYSDSGIMLRFPSSKK
jgi:hypothetical protein